MYTPDLVGAFVLRFVVSPHLYFHNDPHGDKLDATDDEHEAEDEERFAPDVFAHDFQDGKVEVDDGPDEEQHHAGISEEVHGPLEVAFHKKHEQEVAYDLEGTAKSIFRFAVLPGAVVHVHLRDPGPFEVCQYRYEAVQFPIEAQVLGYLAPEHLEGTTVIFHAHIGRVPDDPVGDKAGDFAEPKTILPIRPKACNEVPVTGLRKLQHGGNIGGVVLEVSVHGGNIFALCQVNTCHEGKALAIVFAKFYGMEVAGGDFFQFGKRAIGGAVVHKDDLMVNVFERCRKLFDERSDIFLFVIDTDDDR